MLCYSITWVSAILEKIAMYQKIRNSSPLKFQCDHLVMFDQSFYFKLKGAIEYILNESDTMNR